MLQATDVERSWRFGRSWSVASGRDDAGGGAATVVEASAGDLALLLWERADPLDAPLHPW